MSKLEYFENQIIIKQGIIIIPFVSILFVIMLFHSGKLNAQGNLIIFPKRVVFEGAQKFHQLNLVNSGQDTARYSISIVQIRMKEDGGFENITKPDSGQYFADSYLRIFPRNVVLAPKEAQLVKIQLIKTNLINPGEYRSHIYFRSESNSKPLGEDAAAKDTSQISVRLLPVFGMTVPAIIRVGEPTTKVSISDLSFKIQSDSTPVLSLAINRAGNMSAYGDIKVEHISMQGKITQVGLVQGVAVYTPNLKRRSLMKLTKDFDYSNGKLHLIYTAKRDDKDTKLAEAELLLQ